MSTEPAEDKPTNAAPKQSLRARVGEFISSFRGLLESPWAFWAVIIYFTIDSMAYFGNVTLMEEYIHSDLGAGDVVATITMAIFTGLVSLFMLGVGELAERIGVRRGLLLAAIFCLLGRAAYAAAPMSGLGIGLSMTILSGGLLLIAVGEGIIQPLAYAGVKYYTSERNSSIGYGLIYGTMNLGIFLIGAISPVIRVPVQDIHAARAAGEPEPPSMWLFLADKGVSGINAVNWTCVAISVLAVVFLVVFMTRRAEAARVRGAEEAVPAAKTEATTRLSRWQRLVAYFATGPFSNARFIFFVVMLIPVQTLFAHQLVTMTTYILRDYPKGVSDKAEWIVNWINPGIIFFGSPIIAALTRRVHVYTMMIIGTLVSALPTFLLSGGPNVHLLIVNQVLFAVGEALWSPRFFQYASELAPEGKVAQYMGLANLQWFAAKMITGFYAGWFLAHYCPEGGPHDTGVMWTIYGLIGLASPIGLLIGRRWVMRGQLGSLQSKAS